MRYDECQPSVRLTHSILEGRVLPGPSGCPALFFRKKAWEEERPHHADTGWEVCAQGGHRVPAFTGLSRKRRPQRRALEAHSLNLPLVSLAF